jgi:hypothetical protein
VYSTTDQKQGLKKKIRIVRKINKNAYKKIEAENYRKTDFSSKIKKIHY